VTMDPTRFDRFADLTFEGFRELARDGSLSRHEKVGFPDAYRAGKEGAILRDVRAKLSHLEATGRRVLDVGPGCGDVARELIAHCRERSHELTLIDSPEMLDLLPEGPGIAKRPGRFPEELAPYLVEEKGRLDAVLVYSVIQYVFREGNLHAFFDACLELLAEGGELLIGDIPNRSMRQRFFRSPRGVRFHQGYTGTDGLPPTDPDLQPGHIDDAVLLSLVLRARAAGFDAFLLPQSPDLPMANRREDLLVRRP
jgi:cyclopropane fatty-acyl-phospholipid synthase-like methyltransferase